MVELVELETDVLDGELQQVPETGQVLGGGPGVSIHILTGRGRRGVRMNAGEVRREPRVRLHCVRKLALLCGCFYRHH